MSPDFAPPQQGSRLLRGSSDSRRRRIGLVSAATAVALLLGGAAAPAQAEDAPTINIADTQATAETKSLFRYLQNTEGAGILFGQQHAIDESISATATGPDGQPVKSDTYASTSELPGLFGFDTLAIPGYEKPGSTANTPEQNADLLGQAFVRADALGGVVTLSAHMPNFVTGGTFNDTSGGDIIAQIMPGGPANATFTSYLDRVAQAAQTAVRADGSLVPVIFRPFHENTGSWFWWGPGNSSAGAYKEVFRYTVEYLRDVKGVHNLLYAYSPNGSLGGDANRYLDTYPGDQWVDVMGYDYYQNDASESGTTAWMGQLVSDLSMISKLATEHGKIPALTEFGRGGAATVKDSGNQGLDFFTRVLSAIRSDADASKAAYMLTWANFNSSSIYVPYPGHELEPDFDAYHDDPYTVFANETAGRYGLDATPASQQAMLRLVTPADGVRVTTTPTTVRAKVTGVDPSTVGEVRFWSADDQASAITLTYGSDGYWSGQWQVGEQSLNNSTRQTHLTAVVGGQTLTWDGDVILGSPPVLPAGHVDNFEGYGDNVALRAAYTVNNATSDAISLVDRGDGKAVNLHFDLSTGGYLGFGRSFSSTQNWSGFGELQLFIGAAATGQKLVLQITTADGVFEAYPPLSEVQAGVVSIPWSQWVPAAWDTGHAGATLTPQRLASVTGFWTYVNDVTDAAAHSGDIVLDDIHATGTGDPGDPDQPTGPTIDDFESYADNAALRSTWGKRGKADLLSLTSEASEGTRAMTFTYDSAASGSWIDVSRAVSSSWADSDGLTLAYRGDGSGNNLAIQVGTTDGKYWMTTLPVSNPGWQSVTVPWSAFTPGWPADLTDPISAADLAKVSELVLAMSVFDAAAPSGAIGLDAIQLAGADEPVAVAPTITAQPSSVTVADGATVTFTASADGSPSPAVQWESKAAQASTWTTVDGATTPTLTVAAAHSANGTTYRAVFTNTSGTATTEPATLHVNAVAPTITSQPASVTIKKGQAATFQVSATGTGQLRYQWYVKLPGTRSWIPVVGATAPRFTIPGWLAVNKAAVHVVVRNTAGKTTSQDATLTVKR